MKFKLFFVTLTFYVFSNINSELKYLLLWLILNLSIMSIAYLSHNPKLILGKSSKGEINYFFLFINLPWLLFTWSIFRVQMFVSRENIVDEIAETNIFISSKPLEDFDFDSYDLIVDLTAEFLRDKVADKNYICYPNLDGMALTTSYDEIEIFSNKRVLVHCANGHGRSALFVASLLLDLGFVESFEKGLALVKKSRSLAVPNGEQKVKNINHSLRN